MVSSVLFGNIELHIFLGKDATGTTELPEVKLPDKAGANIAEPGKEESAEEIPRETAEKEETVTIDGREMEKMLEADAGVARLELDTDEELELEQEKFNQLSSEHQKFLRDFSLSLTR